MKILPGCRPLQTNSTMCLDLNNMQIFKRRTKLPLFFKINLQSKTDNCLSTRTADTDLTAKQTPSNGKTHKNTLVFADLSLVRFSASKASGPMLGFVLTV